MSYFINILTLLVKLIIILIIATCNAIILINNNIPNSKSCLVCSTNELKITIDSPCQSVDYSTEFQLEDKFIKSQLYIRCFIDDNINEEVDKIRRKIFVKDGTLIVHGDKDIYNLSDFVVNELNVVADVDHNNDLETLKILHPKV